MLEKPTDEALKSLIMCPEGTVGYQNELALLRQFRAQCDTYGYGRVIQLIKAIEGLWENPENIEKYQKKQKTFNDQMEEYRKELED